ncbi:MAG TPA: MarR family winged helix-turn-helix transcriptional regulator [Kofleriaceae bacterium]|nr:MarR family winged helix-turn-helix transcriptional regulator [Kofleriaceae bacterium]
MSMTGKRFLATFVEIKRVVSLVVWRAMAPMGVGRAQVALLRELWRCGSATQSVLANATSIDPSAAARSFTLLSKRGWIRRRRSTQDRRESYVELTARGKRIMRNVEQVYARASDLLASRLDARDIADFERILAKLAPLADEPERQLPAKRARPTPRRRTTRPRPAKRTA